MKSKRTLLSLGSSAALTGFILSGPVGFLLASMIRPQPAWTSAAAFVAHYSAWQNLPYYFGFVLVGGLLMLAAAHCLYLSNET